VSPIAGPLFCGGRKIYPSTENQTPTRPACSLVTMLNIKVFVSNVEHTRGRHTKLQEKYTVGCLMTESHISLLCLTDTFASWSIS
jgi:hypothetical protein